MWTSLNFEGVRKQNKRARDICKGTSDTEFEQDCSVGLGVTLGDGQKIKIYFSSFRDFSGKSRYCHIVGLRMYYKPPKFNQNRYSHFWENRFFFLCELPLILGFGGKLKERLEVFARGHQVSISNEIGRLFQAVRSATDRQTYIHTDIFPKHIFRMWEWYRIENHKKNRSRIFWRLQYFLHS